MRERTRAMHETWFSEYAEELARCLEDARACAEACEHLLESLDGSTDGGVRRRIVDALLGPAAVSRVLIDLIDQPPALVRAAAMLCRDSAHDAAEVLAGVDAAGAEATRSSLLACADSCAALLEAL